MLYKYLTFFLICLITPFITNAQENKKSCELLKSSILHTYPKNSGEHYVQVIDGDFMYGTNMKTGDTSLYKIEWLDACTLSIQYVEGNEKISEKELRLFKKHKVIYRLQSGPEDYFIYTAHVDKVKNSSYYADTLWLHEKSLPSNSLLFTKISGDDVSQKAVGDSGAYAMLYLYRPGKMALSLSDYLVYFDGQFMCTVHNNSGYVFKIWKEGKYSVTSKQFKDSSSVDLDMKFGKSYFVKSMMNWTISKRLYNFKLEIEDVTGNVGKDEFDKVKLR